MTIIKIYFMKSITLLLMNSINILLLHIKWNPQNFIDTIAYIINYNL